MHKAILFITATLLLACGATQTRSETALDILGGAIAGAQRLTEAFCDATATGFSQERCDGAKAGLEHVRTLHEQAAQFVAEGKLEEARAAIARAHLLIGLLGQNTQLE